MPDAQEIFTGDVPYPNCRADYSVIMTVAQGMLPTRPMDVLKDDQRGNLVWQLLLKCWSRNVEDRPSAGLVVETVSCSALCGISHLLIAFCSTFGSWYPI